MALTFMFLLPTFSTSMPPHSFMFMITRMLPWARITARRCGWAHSSCVQRELPQEMYRVWTGRRPGQCSACHSASTNLGPSLPTTGSACQKSAAWRALAAHLTPPPLLFVSLPAQRWKTRRGVERSVTVVQQHQKPQEQFKNLFELHFVVLVLLLGG